MSQAEVDSLNVCRGITCSCFFPVSHWSDQDMGHHVEYQTDIRRPSLTYDPIFHVFTDTVQKPAGQPAVQNSHFPGWQPQFCKVDDDRHWSPISHVSSSSSYDQSSPGYGSMSPEMATAVLASMVDENSMYHYSTGFSIVYPSASSTNTPTGSSKYSPPTSLLPSQHFSMRDFEHYPDTEDPNLLETNDLFEREVTHQPRFTTLSFEAINDFANTETIYRHTEDDAEIVRIKTGSERPTPSIRPELIDVNIAFDPKTSVEAAAHTASPPLSSARDNTSADMTEPEPEPARQQAANQPNLDSKKHARAPSTTLLRSPLARNKPKKRRISSSSSSFSHGTTIRSTTKQKPTLPCPFHHFGCPATFPNKNEWKRHALSQHLRLGFYRCNLGTCDINHPSGVTRTRGYNDFNRKDLFVQHLRRMHLSVAEPTESGRRTVKRTKKGKAHVSMRMEVGKEKEEEEWIEEVRCKAWIGVRVAPGGAGTVGCGFCEEKFGRAPATVRDVQGVEEEENNDDDHHYDRVSGDADRPQSKGKRAAPLEYMSAMSSRAQDTKAAEDGKGQGIEIWEQRMEHVAAHYVAGAKVEDEAMDQAFKDWAVRERLIVPAHGGEWVLADLAEDAARVDTVLCENANDAAAAPGNVNAPEPVVQAGIRRKGKNSRLAKTGHLNARAAVGVIGTAKSTQQQQQQQQQQQPQQQQRLGSATDVLSGRLGSRKSERLFGSKKRSYAEYEDDDLSLPEEEDKSNLEKRSKHTDIAAKRQFEDGDDVKEERNDGGNDDDDDDGDDDGDDDDEEDEDGNAAQGQNDSDTDAAGEDDD